MRFGNIDFNPANNPAVLDTATWDEGAAARQLGALTAADWSTATDTLARLRLPDPEARITPHRGSLAQRGNSWFFLAGLPDGQQVFIELADGESDQFGAPFLIVPLSRGGKARAFRAAAPNIDRYCQLLRPDKAPTALGPTPRIGIGSRMSAAMWPGSYRAMDEGRFAANTIQNSVRELELLENILAGRPPEPIFYPGLGMVDSGHTGATFEGLLVYGVLAALQYDGSIRYGADADHIKVNPGEKGLERAEYVLRLARYYSMFTLDVSGVLDYGALGVTSSARADAYLEELVPAAERKSIIAYHRQGHRVGGIEYRPGMGSLGRLVGKYWTALGASERLAESIRGFKSSRSFDLELAIDERPPEQETCGCITSDEELAFVLLEARRRGLPITHVAPNFGVEKGVDFRCEGGLPELEGRVERQAHLSSEFGLLLDFHSGDDLSQRTRRAICRATRGQNHFKIAPEPQLLFGATVKDLLPDLFQAWWEDTRRYAQREAEGGSGFAAEALREQAQSGREPAHTDPIFHNFGFAYVGKRDENGRYLNRERLFSLPASFYREYQDRLVRYLRGMAVDLFDVDAAQ